MLNTIFRMIRRANHPTGFEAYLSNVQSRGRGSAPSIDEARRDYREMTRHSQDMLG